jgi:molybdopterin-guanine dinucleotide biosynthesis protein A
MKFSAVILAGGQSQRMGFDKAWLPLRGKPLLARQIELIRALEPAEIFISGRAKTDYSSLGCPVLIDRFEDAGPLAGIERALEVISTPLLLVQAVDMPEMDLSPLRMLMTQCGKAHGGISRVAGRIEPLSSVYPRTALGVAQLLLEKQFRAATHFAERCVELELARFIDLPPRYSRHFKNWNTPADVRHIGNRIGY